MTSGDGCISLWHGFFKYINKDAPRCVMLAVVQHFFRFRTEFVPDYRAALSRFASGLNPVFHCYHVVLDAHSPR